MKQLLHYQAFGQGPVIFLLHGLLGMSDNLASLAKTLSENYRVILPDAINHGQSPHQKVVNYASMAQDVLDLMQSLAIDQAYFLGHSMGGKIAMQLALNRPDKVRALIVADIAPVTYPERYHPILFQAMEQVTGITSRKQADSILQDNGVDGVAVRQFLLKNLRQNEQGAWFWRCGLDNIIANYAAVCAAPDLTTIYDKPSLFIKGGISDYIQPADVPIIEHYFSNTQIVNIDGASHWLHAEYPKQFAEIVSNFLARVAKI